VLVAASTRADGDADEESLIMEAVARAKIPDLLTIIVPRHPQRFDTVEALLEKSGYPYVRRSKLNKPAASKTVDSNVTVLPAIKKVEFVLGDSMGEMFSYYAAADVAFIGGSLLPLGGQNLIEAAAMGKPILIGPHTYNFAQATSMAVDTGAAVSVKDVNELAEALEALFANPVRLKNMSTAAYHFSSKNRGATQRCFELIEPFIYRAKKLYKMPWLNEANE
jgi:3-deoxy-D-manno-octulosonic-acid transferase